MAVPVTRPKVPKVPKILVTAPLSLPRVLGSDRAQLRCHFQGIQHLRLPKIPGFWSLKRELKALKPPRAQPSLGTP